MIGVGWRSRGRGTVSGSTCVGRFGVGSGIVGVVFVHWGGCYAVSVPFGSVVGGLRYLPFLYP